MPLTGPYRWINLAEAAMWIAVGIGVLVLSRRTRAHLLLAIALIAFGLSDVAEVRTGAWWRPPWLLAWKGACVAGIAWGAWTVTRRR